MDTAATFRFDDSYVAEFPIDRHCPPHSRVPDGHLHDVEAARALIRWLVETTRRTRYFNDNALSDDDRLEATGARR